MENTRSIAVPDVDADLADWVTDALDRVESGLSAAVASDDGLLDQGTHERRFDGQGFPSGVYICVLRHESLTLTRRMLLIR